MRSKIILAMLLLLALAACARDEENGDPTESPATGTPAAEIAATTATPRPSATPRPTATFTPTPPQPVLEALDQAVDDDGEIVISRLYAGEPGWVVVYADDGGQPGAVLGHSAVEEGEQQDVMVSVDPYLVTPLLHARLHEDTGEEGEFEFPGADEPLELNGDVVGASLEAELRVTVPGISVSDQALGTDGQVLVDGVSAASPAWVVIYADEGGERGAALGQTAVPEGESSGVVVRFDWRKATRRLHAVLFEDGGEMGRFEPQDGDEAVQVNGETIAAAFTVQLPPDVYVIDQPVVTDEIVVEQAFINEAGWIAVYSNYEGFVDRLLGYTALEAGANKMVRVPIDPRNSTGNLHIFLHVDSAVEGKFDFPADDPPLRDERGNPLYFSFETDAGNYVITADQIPGEDGTVQVPLVVSDLDTWVAVHADEDGQPREILGQTLVERGVQRDVVVTIDVEAATETVYVVLYQDAGVLGEFEPRGPDDVLLRERTPIRAPFRLLE